jgi:hypothetical protein
LFVALNTVVDPPDSGSPGAPSVGLGEGVAVGVDVAEAVGVAVADTAVGDGVGVGPPPSDPHPSAVTAITASKRVAPRRRRFEPTILDVCKSSILRVPR